MRLKRTIIDLFEQAVGARIVRPSNIALLFEEEQLRRFFHHFEVDCVFDVGANSGQYATMIRKRAGYRGPIVSFEPNPDAARILRKNALRDPNWFVEEVALGASVGEATFNVMAMDHYSSLHQRETFEDDLFTKETSILRQIVVKTSTVEIELAKYRQKVHFNRPFLKMDTQGHDVEVALGAREKLKDFVGLQSELAIRRIYANTPNYEEALKFYEDNGFTLSAFVPNNIGHFPYLIETDCIMFRK